MYQITKNLGYTDFFLLNWFEYFCKTIVFKWRKLNDTLKNQTDNFFHFCSFDWSILTIAENFRKFGGNVNNCQICPNSLTGRARIRPVFFGIGGYLVTKRNIRIPFIIRWTGGSRGCSGCCGDCWSGRNCSWNGSGSLWCTWSGSWLWRIRSGSRKWRSGVRSTCL